MPADSNATLCAPPEKHFIPVWVIYCHTNCHVSPHSRQAHGSIRESLRELHTNRARKQRFSYAHPLPEMDSIPTTYLQLAVFPSFSWNLSSASMQKTVMLMLLPVALTSHPHYPVELDVPHVAEGVLRVLFRSRLPGLSVGGQ